MKRFGWQWLVASSLLLGLVAANAETRPQYGGVLHVAMRATPSSLDPADRGSGDSFGHRNITALIFDRLVVSDDSGAVKPALADSWQLSRGSQRCQFYLRHNVKFHDGSVLTPEIVAASLRFANPSWNVQVSGDTVNVEGDSTTYNLLAELSLPRNAIVKRDGADGKLSGTGPFHIVNWDPGKKLTLGAEENHWRGRPYLDGVEIEFGRNLRDQSTALQLGRADLVEIAPEQAQHPVPDGHRVLKSSLIEVLALLFANEAASEDERRLRHALALSVERGSIHDVLLKHSGQPTGGILPTWVSGYGFVFPASADLPRARQLRGMVRPVAVWRLGYDGADSLDRLLADRIALNARDAGLSVQPTSSGPAEIRLVRIPLASPEGWVALRDFLNQCGMLLVVSKDNSIGALYGAERAALLSYRVIPLFHFPVSYASSAAMRNWTVRTDGTWDVSNAWMETANP